MAMAMAMAMATRQVFQDGLDRLYPSQLIRQVGIIPHQIFLLYWLSKLLLAVLAPLLIAEVTASLPFAVLVVIALLGFMLVDIWLLVSRKIHRQAIEKSLGYFIDLIAVFLKSGMNLTQAFRQAAQYGLPSDSALSREVALVVRELEAGGDRDVVFDSLAVRTGVKDLEHLAAVINIGLRVGAPMTETLEAQAVLLRAKQWEKAESLVSRKSLEALFPMMLVCFPLLLVLVFFPAAVQLQALFTAFSGAFG